MNPDEARQIASLRTDLSDVDEETLVDAATALSSECQSDTPSADTRLALDWLIAELIFQRDWKLEELRELGIEQVFVGDALGYYGQGSSDELQMFSDEASKAGILSADRLHVSIRDLGVLMDISDVVHHHAPGWGHRVTPA